MPAYYSVIQYTPDPVIDERINFGVVAFGGGRVQFHFLRNWSRVKSFGANIDALKAFANQAASMSEDMVWQAATQWVNCIQFTKPAGALLDVDELLKYAASRFLNDPQPATKPVRTRRAAITSDRSIAR